MMTSPESHAIFHIDANSAYLSWEAVHRLQHGETVDLRTVPAVVGGDEASRHGIVLAKSAAAKKCGILTGESLMAARQRCPGLLVVPPRYHLYMQCSDAMVSIMKDYSPLIQRYSIDEAFLDYQASGVQAQDAVTTAHSLRERIRNELGFTVNVGIGPNKLLAKMASEFEKPDQVHTLFRHEIAQKMWPLPVDELFFVGRATARKLRNYGIYTIGQLAGTSPRLVHQWLNKPGLLIWQYANGLDDSPVTDQGVPVKSIGNSNTIAFDVTDRETAHQILLALSETVGMRIRKIHKCAHVVSVSIRTSELTTYSHQKRLDTPVDATTLICRSACGLFDQAWKGEAVRHLGVHLSSLCSNDFYQLSLFSPNIEKLGRLDVAMDLIRFRFGEQSVFRGCFTHSPIRPLMGGVLQEQEVEYPMMSSIL